MINKYLNQIQEGILFSDKTISINMHLFEESNPKKLLIIGIAGSGKTTLARHLTKQFKGKACNLDSAWGPYYDVEQGTVVPPTGMSQKTMYDKVKKHWIKMLHAKDCNIIEGVNIIDFFHPKISKGISQYAWKLPVIIIGTSVIKASFRAGSRGRERQIGFWKELIRLGWGNLTFYQKDINWYRKQRLNDSDAVVKEFKIPSSVLS